MQFLKKYPILSFVIIACIAVFLAGAYLTYSAYSAAAAAEKELDLAKTQLNRVIGLEPAPEPENLSMAKANLAAARAAFEDTLEVMRGNAPRDFIAEAGDLEGTTLLLQISEWAAALRRLGAQNNVQVPEGFGFGFDNFLRSGARAPQQSLVPEYYREYKIINYLVRELYKAVPADNDGVSMLLESIRREAIPAGAPPTGGARQYLLKPEELALVTAKKEGVVDTVAVELTFVSRTDAMRTFLQQIASFDMPLVIRSVQVEPGPDIRPAQTQEETTSEETLDEDELGFAFEGFENDEEVNQALGTSVDAKTQIPVVDNNFSRFTILIEYINVVESSEDA